MTRNQAITAAKKAAKRNNQVYFVIIIESGYDIATAYDICTSYDLDTFYAGYKVLDIIYCTDDDLGPQEPPSDYRIFNKRQPNGTYKPLSVYFDTGEN